MDGTPIVVQIAENGLSISDVVQIVCTILSVLVSIISVFIAVSALRQSTKVAKQAALDKQEALRGNIGITFDMLQYQKNDMPYSFFIIKNYGPSPVRLTKFVYDDKLISNNAFKNSTVVKTQFDRLSNLYLAPYQAVRIIYSDKEVSTEDYKFEIAYETNGKVYKDIISINTSPIKGILRGKPVSKEPLESIACLVAELAEHTLG